MSRQIELEPSAGATLAESLRGETRAVDCDRIARELNRSCQCVSSGARALRLELERSESGAELYRLLGEGRSNLFSDSAVFVGERQIARMAEIIAAVERVVAMPAYREHVLASSPAIARHAPGARGVFLGYDFHLTESGPRLIEINTNAGGGMLNAVLGRAQRACCDAVDALLPGDAGTRSPENLFLDMFRSEWRLERGDVPLRRIAIVDQRPAEQYLYPEFVLFARLFDRAGIEALICDRDELSFEGGNLLAAGRPVDLVYNRLTDFSFSEPPATALRRAYLESAVVVTPHPRAHALYADKRNLAMLTDPRLLERVGVDPGTIAILRDGVPAVRLVSREAADSLWAERRRLFFKPAAGFGSRAAYRGDKLTRRVFEEILDGTYVAQKMVPPSERRIAVDGAPVELKLDVRAFVYDRRIQLLAARLYQGQTTNFRTRGGGFAPVLTVPCARVEE
jgi:hypothetical protein